MSFKRWYLHIAVDQVAKSAALIQVIYTKISFSIFCLLSSVFIFRHEYLTNQLSRVMFVGQNGQNRNRRDK